MSDFIERLHEESKELSSKVEALDSFIRSATFNSISPAQQYMLPLQLDAMRAYLEVLNARISDLDFNTPNAKQEK